MLSALIRRVPALIKRAPAQALVFLKRDFRRETVAREKLQLTRLVSMQPALLTLATKKKKKREMNTNTDFSMALPVKARKIK